MSALQVVQLLSVPVGADVVRGVLPALADLKPCDGEGAGELSVKVLADENGGLAPMYMLAVRWW